jgi:hypothetical protein
MLSGEDWRAEVVRRDARKGGSAKAHLVRNEIKVE